MCSLVLAIFHNIFDTVPERPVGNTDNLYFVPDGGSLIHRTKQETFATDDADVHIVKTAIETYEKIKKQVVIGQDVDLLVLLNALTPAYMDILMLKEGNGKIKDRFYCSKDLRNSDLVIECKKSILFLHAISGCDTTSGFYGRRKLQAVQLFNHSKYLYMYTNICISNMYTNVIAPAYLYDSIILFVLFFDDVYCFGINASLASSVLAQCNTTQDSSDIFGFFPKAFITSTSN
ncbi:hypothetical protein AVEN_152499-1 [Araneus ventricosus]|uniref:Uncharacterized protein n=1 Tax=Araneus ventricosus TaxID=182803 RepID=A0A4Y2V5T6_ARAVE|nr:hypothetical protein AVEN_152499-1 [Araneus ventricosus]